MRDQDPGENLRNQRRVDSPKSSVETQTLSVRPSVVRSASPGDLSQNRSAGPSPVSSRGGLVREGSFVRSGSGRKLPQIPERVRSNTLPSSKRHEEEEEQDEDEEQTNKNKPKALEFWESMENIERNDFRYNTIHRMSVGRRMLPKPPGGEGSHSRSQSVDRDAENYRDAAEKMSLNSSFSGPSSLPIHSVPASPHVHHKIPPDGASLQAGRQEIRYLRKYMKEGGGGEKKILKFRSF